MQKKYIALLDGHIADDNSWHRTEVYMKRMDDSVIVRCIGECSDPDADIAITHWRTIYRGDKISMVEAIPETGRTHQLRVTFAYLGHPILGDEIYGKQSNPISRHALHAYSLSIPMPYSEEVTCFSAMPPTDMQNAFRELTGEDITSIINNIKETQ